MIDVRTANASTHFEVFPHLGEAIDAESITGRFAEFLAREYRNRKLRVSDVRIERIYLTPGEDCRIVYRVVGRDRHGRGFEQWLRGRMAAVDRVRGARKVSPPASWPGCDFWKPVSLWPEMEMTLTAFPYDPKLPALHRALDPHEIRRAAEQHRIGLRLPSDAECHAVTIHRVKYRPGKHCVLRYDLALRSEAGSSHDRSVYCKTYRDGTGQYVYLALREICRSRAYYEGALNVPRPVAHIEQARALWQEAWNGVKLASLATDLSWAHRPESDLLPRIAAMLARLHELEGIDAPLVASRTVDRVLVHAEESADSIGRFLPRRIGMLARLVDRLASAMPSSTDGRPRALVHGAFKLTQILVRDGQLGLVDFDAVGRGDPWYDVAEFVASLLYLNVSDQLPVGLALQGADRFITAYERAANSLSDRKRVMWYVTAFLLVKLHASLKALALPCDDEGGEAFRLIDTAFLASIGRRSVP